MLQVLWVRHLRLSVMRCYEGLHGAILGKSCQNVDKQGEEVVLNFFRGSLTAHSRHHCLLYLDNRGEGDDPRATIWGSEINPLSFTRDDKARSPGSSLGMNRGTASSPHYRGSCVWHALVICTSGWPALCRKFHLFSARNPHPAPTWMNETNEISWNHSFSIWRSIS